MGKRKPGLIHPTAIVSEKATVGRNTHVWAFAQIRERAMIGPDSMIASGVYVDAGVIIGRRCNVHNRALLYRNLIVEDDAFIGPGVCFTNDPLPRANRIRALKGRVSIVRRHASIGANATILPEITIGAHAVVGAGAVVTRDVPDYGLVYGVPARLMGFVSPEGRWLSFEKMSGPRVYLSDPGDSRRRVVVPKEVYDQIKS